MSLVYFSNEDYQNDFQNKLKEFNQVWECYAHEKTQTPTNVIMKSERILWYKKRIFRKNNFPMDTL